jgi:hypothetical protein
MSFAPGPAAGALTAISRQNRWRTWAWIGRAPAADIDQVEQVDAEISPEAEWSTKTR